MTVLKRLHYLDYIVLQLWTVVAPLTYMLLRIENSPHPQTA